MDLINKKFRDRITGKIIVIKDAYQNIAITTSNEKIDTKLLLKGDIFEYINESAVNHQQQMESNVQDEIDPAKFMGGDPTTRYTNLLNKIQTIDESRVPTIVNEPVKIKMSSNLTPTDKSEPINYGRIPTQNQQHESESAIIIETDEDFEMKQLEKKYSINKKMDVSKHNETFAKYFDADESVSLNTNAPVPHNLESKNKAKEIIEIQQPEKVEKVNVDRNIRHNQIQNEEEYVERIEVKDPVIDMFEKVKRSFNFNMNIKIQRDIPRLDFIEMMEDSYDISIIEYLADEILNNILNNPMDIKTQIMEEIKSKIYKSTTSEKKIEKVEKVKQIKTKGRPKKIKEENDKGIIS